MLKVFFAFLIRGYQKILSPILGHRCRFYPSCSEYALEALEYFSLFKALKKIIWRLLRCGPWAKGGVDFLVLPKTDEKKELI